MTETIKRHIVIGTAGHIDHGKSALIKALTGTDPDRLKEEKERGMTTDIGFAFYRDDVTIIDVPGHEKFIRNMLVGASTIDFVMLVIAADDGVMPQTIEHFEILKLLGIKKGVVVVTKKDLVKDDWLEIVVSDIKNLLQNTFLENAPIIPVSNISNEGIDNLRKVLDQLIAETEVKQDRGIFRMPIDRCFTIKGFGTVVAGTILSGVVKVGDALEVLPQKKSAKVRGIEVHNKKVEQVGTGFRAAINLAGVEREEVERGNVLGQPGFLEPSNFLNASLHLLSSTKQFLKNFTRVRIHLGTSEILGRVVILEKKILEPGQKAMVQFRLETPGVSDVGDRYVIRTYSPQTTVGGGVIIEPKASKVKGYDEQLIEHLQKIETGDPKSMVEENLITNFELPRKINEIAYDINLLASEVQNLIKNMMSEGQVICIDEKRGLYYSTQNFEKLKGRILDILKDFHTNNPTLVGMPRLELATNISRGLDNSLLNYAFEKMAQGSQMKISEDNKISRFDFNVVLDKDSSEIIKKIENIFLNAGYQPPDYDNIMTRKLGPDLAVKKAYRYMLDTGILIFLGEEITMHQKAVAQAKEKLIQFLKEHKEIRIAQFRDILGNTSRKYVLPLLNYFDTHHVTIKRGDVRILDTELFEANR